MKCIVKFLLLVILVGYSPNRLFSQIIYLENGFALTSTGGISPKETKYQVAIGLDYFSHKSYFLSSGISYMKKGNDLFLWDVENMTASQKMKNRYFSTYTLFNVKKEFSLFDIYIGAGPRFDIRIKDKDIAYEKQIVQPFLWGLKCDVGINYFVNNWMIGAKFSYLPTFMNMYKNENVKDRTITLGMSIGYKL